MGFLEIDLAQDGPFVAQLKPWGIVTGRLVDEDGLPRPHVRLYLEGWLEGQWVGSLTTSHHYGEQPQTDTDGQFRIANVAIGSYSLKAVAPPFEAVVQTLTVADARPVTLQLRLAAATAEQVNVTAEASQPATTTTKSTKLRSLATSQSHKRCFSVRTGRRTRWISTSCCCSKRAKVSGLSGAEPETYSRR